jgi:predicted  nucleic acid-binding Zn-ribbon protein
MFQNFGKKIGDLAQTAAKKSGELAQTAAKKSGEMVEITKLNMNITSEENSIEKLYTEIGKLYYSSIENGTELDAGVAEICQKIKAHKDNIAQIKEKINSIKQEEE